LLVPIKQSRSAVVLEFPSLEISHLACSVERQVRRARNHACTVHCSLVRGNNAVIDLLCRVVLSEYRMTDYSWKEDDSHVVDEFRDNGTVRVEDSHLICTESVDHVGVDLAPEWGSTICSRGWKVRQIDNCFLSNALAPIDPEPGDSQIIHDVLIVDDCQSARLCVIRNIKVPLTTRELKGCDVTSRCRHFYYHAYSMAHHSSRFD